MPSPPRFWTLLAALGTGIGVAAMGCANIGSPTGGPVDQTPPSLVASLPEDGATNVTDRTLRLAFSERLAPGSAPRAVRVVPETGSPPRVRVRGDEIEVRFDSLREATTYVVTIGTELTDDRSVALSSPITVAFATGDQIDRGEITGTVRAPQTGQGAGSLAVLAYPTDRPDLSAAPDYRTETGTDGRFRLAYLRPDSFFVVAVEDRNRNGRVDAGERVAVPPQPLTASALPTDSTTRIADLDLWIAARDTVPPQPRRVRPISDRRFAVRFDEPVQILARDGGVWALTDSVSGSPVSVVPYQDPVQPAEVRFQTDEPLTSSAYRIRLARPNAVADSAGASVRPFALTFSPADRADTLAARFVGFTPEAQVAADSAQALRPSQAAGVRFAAPPDTAALAGRVEVVRDTTVQRAALVPSLDGLGLEVRDLAPGRFTLRLRQPDSTYSRRYVVLGDRETGGIIGTVPNAEGRPVIVEATLGDGTVVRASADADGTFAFSGLAPGSVRLRVFEDRDRDGTWSGGRLPPDYAPAEPLLVVGDDVQIRARWDTEVAPAQLALFPDTP